jgi:GxxExxY protein
MHGLEPDPQTFQIIGAAMEVHRRMQRGLYELFYSAALAVEFELRQIPFYKDRPIRLQYKGRALEGTYKIDFVCFETVVVEVKAVSALTPADESQLLNYLAMTNLERGLLINFGTKSLEYKRRVL